MVSVYGADNLFPYKEQLSIWLMFVNLFFTKHSHIGFCYLFPSFYAQYIMLLNGPEKLSSPERKKE